MSDLLNGPVIAGPRYSTHGDQAGAGVLELEDTPGCRIPGIPTERLDESPEGLSVSRKRLRLMMAWGLFCSKHTGSMLSQGNTDGLRSWCWQQADKFISEADRPSPRPTEAVMVNGGPHTAEAVKLVEIDDAA